MDRMESEIAPSAPETGPVLTDLFGNPVSEGRVRQKSKAQGVRLPGKSSRDWPEPAPIATELGTGQPFPAE